MNEVRVTYNQPVPYGGLKALEENKEINVKIFMKTNEIDLRFFSIALELLKKDAQLIAAEGLSRHESLY